MPVRWKAGFIPRQIAGEYVLVPVGEAAKQVRGMLGLSESGYLLYSLLQEERSRQELIDALLREYDADPETARQDVDDFLAGIDGLGLLEK